MGDLKINNLISFNKKELALEMSNIGEKPFRANQIWQWIYLKHARDFDQFNNISKDLREKLKANYSISPPQIIKDLISKDGTRKWLIKFDDGQEVEMVFIPEEKRGTLCVSSQVGCTLTCTFCHTGTQRLVRNLKTQEILWQFLVARDLLQNSSVKNEKKEPLCNEVTNVVFMGMGEPLFNYENVKRAIQTLCDESGINLSKRRVTLSTSGVVPEMFKYIDEINGALAVSLHATNDEVRDEIMPINKKYPLKELIKAIQHFNKNNSRKATLEYVMLKDINDSDDDANNLVKMIKENEIYAKVNLIPFNPWQEAIYECSSRNRIMKFHKILKNNKIEVTVRRTRGEDVMAACGQLKSLSKSKKLIRDS